MNNKNQHSFYNWAESYNKNIGNLKENISSSKERFRYLLWKHYPYKLKEINDYIDNLI